MRQRIPRRRIIWRRSYRLIPARFPPIALFERVADPEDWEDLIAIESLTNDRIRDEIGEIALVPPAQRVTGPGASWVMGAFTHIGHPSRFSDGTYGTYYTARTRDCAVAETCYHLERFLAATREPACTVDMRVLIGGIDGLLEDVRQETKRMAQIYDRDDYGASQAFARQLRSGGANGIVYRSVRLASGECAAAFHPKVVRPMPRGDIYLQYVWDTRAIPRYWDYAANRWVDR